MTGPTGLALPRPPRSSSAWWRATKAEPALLTAWLRKAYQGEVTAADRIHRHGMARLPDIDHRRVILRVIADQELLHARWIGELLRVRGEAPRGGQPSERYWSRTLPAIGSFEDAAGVAYHAEAMGLERVEVIARDGDAPADLRTTFARILIDERFHVRAFARMAGAAAIERTRAAHCAGAQAIGFLALAGATR